MAKRHARGFAWVAKEFEKKFKRDHPGATVTWSMYMTRNKNNTAGGRAFVEQAGYNSKTYMVYADTRSWSTS